MASNQSDLDVNIRGNDQLSPELAKVQSNIIRWVGAISSALSAIQVAAFPVTSIRDFEREMANVTKTTGFTAQQTRDLSDNMIELSRRVNRSAVDLAKIAAAAGQMGLGSRGGVEGITQFTDSVARMSSVLDVTVEQAGLDVGKLVSIFKLPLAETERMVSAFNEVANNSTAKGEQLLDVVKRIGDAAGTINLQQAIGLGAAGIDMGFSPEVVGTSINKIFADMQSKADKFSKFMEMSTKEWVDIIAQPNGGITAYKLYLDRLRTMTLVDRQRAIRELSGTGRIGSLVNKSVEDTVNETLDRNLNSANRGFDTGTSALKEQRTVLETLSDQAGIVGNAFKALGIAAGTAFVKPTEDAQTLTNYMAQLSEAFGQPSFIHFAESVGKGMKDMIDWIARAVTEVASWQVNWENLLQVFKVLMGLKVADVMTGWLGKGTAGFGAMAASAKELAKNLQSVASAQTTSQIQSIIDKTKEMGAASSSSVLDALAKRKLYIKALEEQKAAQDALRASEAALAAAQVSQKGAEAFQQRATRALVQPQIEVDTARAALTAAAASQAVQQVQAAQRAREEQATAAHQTNLTAIETRYQTARAAAKAAGDDREIRRLRTVRLEEIAAEEQRNARSLTGIQSYYTRRLAIVEAATQAEIAARQRALVAAEASLATAAARPGQALASEGVQRAAQTVSDLTNAVEENRKKVNAAAKVAEVAGKAYSLLGTALSLVTSGFRLLLRWAGPAMLIFTTVYSILDATVGMEKVVGWFQRFGEALGLVSKESQKEAVAASERAKQQEKEAARLKDLIELRKKYYQNPELDDSLSQDRVNQLNLSLKSDNADTRAQARQQVLDILASAQAELDKDGATLDVFPIDRDKKIAEVEELGRQVIAAQQAVDEKLASMGLGDETGAARGFNRKQAAEVGKMQRELASLKVAYDEANAAAKKYSDTALAGLQFRVGGATKDIEAMKESVTKLFTPESAQVVIDFGEKLAASQKRQAEAQEAVAKSGQASMKGNEDAARQAAEAAREQQEATDEANKIAAEFNARILMLKNTPGVSDTTINSLEHLRDILRTTPEMLVALVRALRTLNDQNVTFTGELVSNPIPSSRGDNTANTVKDSEIRKLAKARIELRKAQLEAEAKLERDYNQELERILDQRNQNGLLSLKAYYDEKTRIALADNATQIKLAQAERAAIAEEAKVYTQESDKVRSQAQMAKLNGDIAALEQQRKFIVDGNARAMADAARQFQEQVGQQSLEVLQAFGGQDGEVFQRALDGYQAQYRVFLARLKEEAKDAPELLPLVSSVESLINLRALETQINQITKETQLASRETDRFGQRIEALYSAGLISQLEYNKGLGEQQSAQLKILETEKLRLQAALDRIPVEERNTLIYKEQANQLKDVQLQMDLLRIKGDETAKQINKSLTDAIADGLGSFKAGDSFSAMLRGVIETFAQDIQKMMAQSISSMLVGGLNSGLEALGLGGGNGIGGMISSFLGTNSAETLGTAGNPMYVVDVNGAATAAAGGLAPGILDAANGSKAVKDAVSKANSSDDPIGSMIDGLSGENGPLGSIASGMSSFANDFLDLFSGFGSSLGSVVNQAVNMVSQFLLQLFQSQATSGIAGGAAAVMHTGGIVGSGGVRSRAVPAGMFAGAARFHGGGFPGLKANEVPAILEKGERVMTEKQQQAAAAAAASGGGGGVSSIRNVLVMDPNEMANAMRSQQGEKVTMTHIKANAPAIRQMLGVGRN